MVVKGKFSKKPPPPTIVLPKSTNPYIKTIGALQSKPNPQEAFELIYEIANLVGPIMKENSFKVGQLAEFYPKDKCLLGLNFNRGLKIQLRLRHPYNEQKFYDKYHILGTMLHELTHNLFGPHDSKFHNKLNELIFRQEQLLANGMNQLVFEGHGNRLGGLHWGPQHVNEARLKKLDKKFTGGANTLGGTTSDLTRMGDIKSLVRNAALNRFDGSDSTISECSHFEKVEEVEDDDDLQILDIRKTNKIKSFVVKKDSSEPTVGPPSVASSKRIVAKVYEQADPAKAANADKIETLIKKRPDQPLEQEVLRPSNTPKAVLPKKRRAGKIISEKVKEVVRGQWENKEVPKRRKLETEPEIIQLTDESEDNDTGGDSVDSSKELSEVSETIGIDIIDLTDA